MTKVGLDEADYCPYCGATLYYPPECCPEAMEQHANEVIAELDQIQEDMEPFQEKP